MLSPQARLLFLLYLLTHLIICTIAVEKQRRKTDEEENEYMNGLHCWNNECIALLFSFCLFVVVFFIFIVIVIASIIIIIVIGCAGVAIQ